MTIGQASKAIVFVLLVIFDLSGCKPRRDRTESQGKADTKINYGYVDLTTFTDDGSEVTEAEMRAVKDYTSDNRSTVSRARLNETIYGHINRALRGFIEADINAYDDTIKKVSSLVNKTRNGRCNFWRYIDANRVLSDGQTLAQKISTSGSTFIERGFMSSSESNVAPKGFELMTDIIIGTSAACARISRYSAANGEKEVLFPPGSEFKVIRDAYVDQFGRRIFQMQEIAPGTSKSSASMVDSVGDPPVGGGFESGAGLKIAEMYGTFRSAKGSELIVERGGFRYRFFTNTQFYTLAEVKLEDGGQSVRVTVAGSTTWFKFTAIGNDVVRSTWSGGSASDYIKVRTN